MLGPFASKKNTIEIKNINCYSTYKYDDNSILPGMIPNNSPNVSSLYLEQICLLHFNDLGHTQGFDHYVVNYGDVELHNASDPYNAYYKINYQDSEIEAIYVKRYKLNVNYFNTLIEITSIEGINGIDYVFYSGHYYIKAGKEIKAKLMTENMTLDSIYNQYGYNISSNERIYYQGKWLLNGTSYSESSSYKYNFNMPNTTAYNDSLLDGDWIHRYKLKIIKGVATKINGNPITNVDELFVKEGDIVEIKTNLSPGETFVEWRKNAGASSTLNNTTNDPTTVTMGHEYTEIEAVITNFPKLEVSSNPAPGKGQIESIGGTQGTDWFWASDDGGTHTKAYIKPGISVTVRHNYDTADRSTSYNSEYEYYFSYDGKRYYYVYRWEWSGAASGSHDYGISTGSGAPNNKHTFNMFNVSGIVYMKGKNAHFRPTLFKTILHGYYAPSNLPSNDYKDVFYHNNSLIETVTRYVKDGSSISPNYGNYPTNGQFPGRYDFYWNEYYEWNSRPYVYDAINPSNQTIDADNKTFTRHLIAAVKRTLIDCKFKSGTELIYDGNKYVRWNNSYQIEPIIPTGKVFDYYETSNPRVLTPGTGAYGDHTEKPYLMTWLDTCCNAGRFKDFTVTAKFKNTNVNIQNKGGYVVLESSPGSGTFDDYGTVGQVRSIPTGQQYKLVDDNGGATKPSGYETLIGNIIKDSNTCDGSGTNLNGNIRTAGTSDETFYTFYEWRHTWITYSNNFISRLVGDGNQPDPLVPVPTKWSSDSPQNENGPHLIKITGSYDDSGFNNATNIWDIDMINNILGLNISNNAKMKFPHQNNKYINSNIPSYLDLTFSPSSSPKDTLYFESSQNSLIIGDNIIKSPPNFNNNKIYTFTNTNNNKDYIFRGFLHNYVGSNTIDSWYLIVNGYITRKKTKTIKKDRIIVIANSNYTDNYTYHFFKYFEDIIKFNGISSSSSEILLKTVNNSGYIYKSYFYPNQVFLVKNSCSEFGILYERISIIHTLDNWFKYDGTSGTY